MKSEEISKISQHSSGDEM